MTEKEIFFIRTNTFKGKDKLTTYYQVDYVRLDRNFEPKSDFISASEFAEINKKMKDKNLVPAVGIFKINDHDKLYCSAIK